MLVATLLHWPLAAPAGAETRHVLVLSSSERPYAPQSGFAEIFIRDLVKSSHEPIEFVEVSVQAARASGEIPDAATAQRIRDAFASRKLDLVVTIGGPAATFAQQFRKELFPATPMLMAGVDRRFVERGTFTANETTVATRHEPALMIDEILRLLPETRTVLVVVGASQIEQFWLAEMKREFARFDRQLEFVWTNELSFAEIVERCRTMPPHSAIFFALMALDGKGEPLIEQDSLSALHAVANAPMFSLYGMGRGIVGGPLPSSEELSRTTSQVALRVLAGESPGSVQTRTHGSGQPTYDARELRRWKIDERRLPSASVVLFREPTIWQRYRWPVAFAGLLAAGPAALVLLAGRKKRRDARRARVELSNLSRHLMQAHEDERAAIARTLHEDVCQRMTALTVSLHSVQGAAPGTPVQAVVADVSEKLASLAGDLAAVSDSVHKRLELLGLACASRRFCADLAARHDVAIHFRDDQVPQHLPIDVALALFRVLQEAAENAVVHSGARDVWVAVRGTADDVRLHVVDRGVGFDVQRAAANGGVGLVAIRERLRLVNGDSVIESAPGEGTRVEAWVPLRAGAALR